MDSLVARKEVKVDTDSSEYFERVIVCLKIVFDIHWNIICTLVAKTTETNL